MYTSRYMKCLSCGMRREAVQEERQRTNNGGGGGGAGGSNNNKNDNEVESTSGIHDMPIERILEAENLAEGGQGGQGAASNNDMLRMHPGFGTELTQATNKRKMLHQLVEWAKLIPHFTDLKTEDQVRNGWVSFAYRSHWILV